MANSYIKNFGTVAEITAGVSALENGQLFTCTATGFMYKKTSGSNYTKLVGREESAVHKLIQDGNTYSTAERALDEIAPNGKQVYTRSWTGTSNIPSGGTLATIPSGLNLIDLKAYAWYSPDSNTTRFLQANRAANGAYETYFWEVYYNQVNGNVQSTVQGPYASKTKNWTLTVKYTK